MLAAKHELTHVLLMERLVRRLRAQMDETICDSRSALAWISSRKPTNRAWIWPGSEEKCHEDQGFSMIFNGFLLFSSGEGGEAGSEA